MSLFTIEHPLATDTGPDTIAHVHVQLFHDVTNIGHIIQLATVTPQQVPDLLTNVILLNPTKVPSKTVLSAAIHRAFYHNATDTMKTRSLGTEIMYYLSPSSKIKDVIAHIGLNVAFDSVLAIRILPKLDTKDAATNSQIGPAEDSHGAHEDKAEPVIGDEIDLGHLITGKRVALDSLIEYCDIRAIAKLWKLNADQPFRDFELDLIESIALKGH